MRALYNHTATKTLSQIHTLREGSFFALSCSWRTAMSANWPPDMTIRREQVRKLKWKLL